MDIEMPSKEYSCRFSILSGIYRSSMGQPPENVLKNGSDLERFSTIRPQSRTGHREAISKLSGFDPRSIRETVGLAIAST